MGAAIARWRIDWRGRTFVSADLTVAHATIIGALADDPSWLPLDPSSGPQALAIVLGTFIAVADERDVLEVLAEIGQAPLDEIVSALTTEGS